MGARKQGDGPGPVQFDMDALRRELAEARRVVGVLQEELAARRRRVVVLEAVVHRLDRQARPSPVEVQCLTDDGLVDLPPGARGVRLVIPDGPVVYVSVTGQGLVVDAGEPLAVITGDQYQFEVVTGRRS